MRNRKTPLTATQRALRIDRRTGGRCAVLLWTSEDNEASVRVVRGGRVIVLGLSTGDFSRRPLNAVRWAAKHYRVDVVYVVRSRSESDDHTACRKYTRRPTNPLKRRREGTVSDPDFRRPG